MKSCYVNISTIYNVPFIFQNFHKRLKIFKEMNMGSEKVINSFETKNE